MALNAHRATRETIRAVVLDGTISPALSGTAMTTAKAQEHFTSLFDQCAADAFCAETYPDLGNRFIAVIEDLGASPLVLDPPLVSHDFLRGTFGLIDRIDPKFFARFGRLNNGAAWGGLAPFLPLIVEALENRDDAALRLVLGGGTAVEAPNDVQSPPSAEDVLEADDIFLAPAIDLVLATAAATAENTDPGLSDDWVHLIVGELTARLRAGETQAEVIKDLVEMAMLPLKGTDRAALEDFARGHLDPDKAPTANALVAAMSRQDVRATMWAIQDVGSKMSGRGERDSSLGVALGLLNAINCAEDISPTPVEVPRDYADASPYPGVFVQSVETHENLREACTHFPAPFTKDEVLSPVVSDTPVMIFQEELDTQTPVSFGKAALETLENGFFLEWPSEGHVIATVLVLAAGLAAAPAAAQTEEVVPRLRPLDFAPFEAGIEGLDPELIAAPDRILPTLSVPGLQALMAAGELSSETLTLYLLHRAASYDETFRIFIELNPQALDAARAADALFAEGTVLGPMQGIPVTLKDNIGTAGPIYTTAGPRS